MEKQGVIKQGITPPEIPSGGEKEAEHRLEDHLTRRISSAVVNQKKQADTDRTNKVN